MLAHVLDAIAHYGYAGLFAALVLGIAGLPIPDETILVFCGYLISRGRMAAGPAYASGAAGAICGITVSYIIGRTAGAAVVEHWGRYVGIRKREIDRAHRWFETKGEWVLTFGYFVLGVRHVTALVAGIARLRIWKFALFAYSGALFWVATFLTIGYWVGARWQVAVELAHRYSIVAAVAIVVAAVPYYCWRRWKLGQVETGPE